MQGETVSAVIMLPIGTAKALYRRQRDKAKQPARKGEPLLLLRYYSNQIVTAKPPLKKKGSFNTSLVEAAGVEPASESTLTGLSPGAVRI